MAIVNELNSVADFVKTTFPSATVVKQTIPSQPTANLFVVRVLTDRRETETRYHTVVERDYQIVYFGSNVSDVLAKMDDFSRKVMNNNIVISIQGSTRYIRVESFSFSQPFKTENGIDAAVGVLTTQVREARDQSTYTTIAGVNVTLQ